MRAVKTLKGVVLALALATLASGCATVKMSSAKTCAAPGGTYNATAKTCSYTQSTRSAQQICQSHEGYYDPTNDTCSFNP
jgi:uncharacterized protein YceK